MESEEHCAECENSKNGRETKKVEEKNRTKEEKEEGREEEKIEGREQEYRIWKKGRKEGNKEWIKE